MCRDNWVVRLVASTLIRRLTVLALLAVLAWAGMGRAEAACGYLEECTYSQAVATCEAYKASEAQAGRPRTDCAYNPTDGNCPGKGSIGNVRISGGDTQWWCLTVAKPEKNCSAEPPLNAMGMLSGPACVGGCTYMAGPNNRTFDSSDPSAITFADSWLPTGATCTASEPEQKPYDPNKPVCNKRPGTNYIECVDPEGNHCVTSARGTRMCWGPGHEGDRNSSDGKDGANRKKAPNLPTIPTIVADPTPAGPATPTIINNTTYNTQSWTGTGTNGAGQGNTGDGGKDGGDGGDGGEEGEEGDDGETGDVGGGNTCGAAPACTATTAYGKYQCWLISQHWRSVCLNQDDADSGLLKAASDLGKANLQEEIEAQVEAGNIKGTDGQGDLDTHRVVKKLQPNQLDASGFLGAGQCPSFPVPSVNGVSLGIDLSKMCDFLSSISNLVLGLAYFLAFRIIAGGGRS